MKAIRIPNHAALTDLLAFCKQTIFRQNMISVLYILGLRGIILAS